MFGDRPALSPPEIFYQRMLAGDPVEALDKAEQFLQEKPLSAYYDEVALKGLKLAQIDLGREALDGPHLQRVRDAVVELVSEFDEYDDQPRKKELAQDAEAAAVDSVGEMASSDLPVVVKDDLAEDWRGEKPVLCVAGRTGLDEAAARMLAQILSKHGLGARVEDAEALSTTNIFHLETKGTALACISFMDDSSAAQMRYAIRRMRRKLPHAKIILGCWMAGGETSTIVEATKADAVAVTLRDAARLCFEEATARPAQEIKLETKVASGASA
jgi:hypothetical protein